MKIFYFFILNIINHWYINTPKKKTLSPSPFMAEFTQADLEAILNQFRTIVAIGQQIRGAVELEEAAEVFAANAFEDILADPAVQATLDDLLVDLFSGGLGAGLGVTLFGISVGILNNPMAASDFAAFIEGLFSLPSDLIQIGHGGAEAKTPRAAGLRASAAITMPTKIDSNESNSVPLATSDTRASGAWHKIDGLADDQVFMVQRWRITYNSHAAVAFSGWYFIMSGRPFGSHVGQRSEDLPVGFVSLGPVPGTTLNSNQFAYGDALRTITDQFNYIMQLKPIAVFRVQMDGGLSSPSTFIELDLSPNYIPLRSYWTLWLGDDSTEDGPQHVLQSFGKKMPYFIPDDLFSMGH